MPAEVGTAAGAGSARFSPGPGRGASPGPRRPGAAAGAELPRAAAPVPPPQALEEQYSPSRWSPRLGRDTIIQAHLAATAAGEGPAAPGRRGGSGLRAPEPGAGLPLGCRDPGPAGGAPGAVSVLPQGRSGPGLARRPYCTSPMATVRARSWTSIFPRILLEVGDGVAGAAGAGRGRAVPAHSGPCCAAFPVLVYIHGGYWQCLR